MPKVTKQVSKKRAPDATDSGPSTKTMKVEDSSEEFQEGQLIPSEEFQEGQVIPDQEYQSPPAPSPMVHVIPDEKGCFLMAPRPRAAYRLGVRNKFLTLNTDRNGMYAELMEVGLIFSTFQH